MLRWKWQFFKFKVQTVNQFIHVDVAFFLFLLFHFILANPKDLVLSALENTQQRFLWLVSFHGSFFPSHLFNHLPCRVYCFYRWFSSTEAAPMSRLAGSEEAWRNWFLTLTLFYFYSIWFFQGLRFTVLSFGSETTTFLTSFVFSICKEIWR